MINKDGLYEIMDKLEEAELEALKAVKKVDELADAAEQVVDAAEEVSNEIGGLLSRILNGLARFINYIKGIFKRKD